MVSMEKGQTPEVVIAERDALEAVRLRKASEEAFAKQLPQIEALIAEYKQAASAALERLKAQGYPSGMLVHGLPGHDKEVAIWRIPADNYEGRDSNYEDSYWLASDGIVYHKYQKMASCHDLVRGSSPWSVYLSADEAHSRVKHDYEFFGDGKLFVNADMYRWRRTVERLTDICPDPKPKVLEPDPASEPEPAPRRHWWSRKGN